MAFKCSKKVLKLKNLCLNQLYNFKIFDKLWKYLLNKSSIKISQILIILHLCKRQKNEVNEMIYCLAININKVPNKTYSRLNEKYMYLSPGCFFINLVQ